MKGDREIVSLFLARSETAIEELEAKYGRLIRSVAKNILKDERDAEEAVQDACLAVWDGIPPDDPKSLMAYTAGIARNIAVKAYHRNTAKKRNSFYDAALEELAECLPAGGTPESELLKKELTGIINRFLENESREDRVIFVRRYWFSDGIPAIAKRLGMSENGVSVRLSRTRKRLRKHLEKEGYTV